MSSGVVPLFSTHIFEPYRTFDGGILSLLSLSSGDAHPEAIKPQLLTNLGTNIEAFKVFGDFISLKLETESGSLAQIFNWKTGDRLLVRISNQLVSDPVSD